MKELDDFEDSDERWGGEAVDNADSFPNFFGVADDGHGNVVCRKRPPGRMSRDEALNLVAWIVNVTEVDMADLDELARQAVEAS